MRRLLRSFVKQLRLLISILSQSDLFCEAFAVFLRVMKLDTGDDRPLYRESFGQFHDQAHWSGEFIVLLRVTLRLTVISGALITYPGSEKQDQLRTSMEDIALL